ncbi:MAG: hypothetical protein M1830_002464 [Pleopsidium flavum]|nr:MAG: hypothetical protein M1830_002464 [Pleopsidium flavum]
MLRSTVLTTYLFAVFILRLGALRVEGRFSSHYELIGRAAAKAATVLGHVGSGHLHTRQQTYAPGDPAYQADRQNELNICLVDPPTPPEDCSDSQVSFDDCANTT